MFIFQWENLSSLERIDLLRITDSDHDKKKKKFSIHYLLFQPLVHTGRILIFKVCASCKLCQVFGIFYSDVLAQDNSDRWEFCPHLHHQNCRLHFCDLSSASFTFFNKGTLLCPVFIVLFSNFLFKVSDRRILECSFGTVPLSWKDHFRFVSLCGLLVLY